MRQSVVPRFAERARKNAAWVPKNAVQVRRCEERAAPPRRGSACAGIVNVGQPRIAPAIAAVTIVVRMTSHSVPCTLDQISNVRSIAWLRTECRI